MKPQEDLLHVTLCATAALLQRHTHQYTNVLARVSLKDIFLESIFLFFSFLLVFPCVTAGGPSLHRDTKCYFTVHALFAMVQSSSTYKFISYMNVIAMVKLHCVYVCIHCTTVRIKSTAACCVIARLHLLARIALRCLTHN